MAETAPQMMSHEELVRHLIELIDRICLTCLLTVMSFFLFSLFPAFVQHLYPTGSSLQAEPGQGRWLWAALGSFYVFFYICIFQLYGYIRPALYRHEARVLAGIAAWILMAPLLGWAAPQVQAWIARRPEWGLVVSDPSALFLRVLVVWTLMSFFLVMPRRKKNLSATFIATLILLALILPGHVFYTMTAATVEMAAILLLVMVFLRAWLQKA